MGVVFGAQHVCCVCVCVCLPVYLQLSSQFELWTVDQSICYYVYYPSCCYCCYCCLHVIAFWFFFLLKIHFFIYFFFLFSTGLKLYLFLLFFCCWKIATSSCCRWSSKWIDELTNICRGRTHARMANVAYCCCIGHMLNIFSFSRTNVLAAYSLSEWVIEWERGKEKEEVAIWVMAPHFLSFTLYPLVLLF